MIMRHIDADALIKKLFPYDVVDKIDVIIWSILGVCAITIIGCLAWAIVGVVSHDLKERKDK